MLSGKLNRIGTNGKYMDNEAFETVLPGPVAGSSANSIPAQVAHAVTLQTGIARGRGSKGRFYLPPLGTHATLGTDGRITTTVRDQLATACVALIDDINDVYAGAGAVGVASDVGSGVHAAAVEVRVGRVPDTIRSRRSSLAEDYGVAAIA